MAEQEVQLGRFFDTIIVCSVSGSMHASIIVGFKLLEKTGWRPRKLLRTAKLTAGRIWLTKDDISDADTVETIKYSASMDA
ncbi:hypothetical protein B0H19DRAFT_1263721 [Mycena capillaripes]|nr:hypothetical protein B0H19DRAFT_1263721 [Mycena capillaripes]